MKCWIDKAAMKTMIIEANRKDPLETGGCLMGYWACPNEVVVCRVVGPGPNAKHERLNFEPDYKYQTKAVGDVFDEFEGIITYLGDWHTHPGGYPFPSPLDIKALRQLSRSEEARTPVPLMVILGGLGSFLNKSAYVLNDGRLISLEVIDFDYIHKVRVSQ